jgi:DNA-binding winged helix-turn-helix (wHTH) protein/pimeloyl-ACP methyl ester carboxylesterase
VLGEERLQFRFAEYQLDMERRELRRGAEQVNVEPQVFDLLVFLIQNRDRVVTKDDLLDAVWQGRIVSESTLTSRIKAARSAIGDNGEDQRLIKTLPRKGFRFVAQTDEVQASRQCPATDASINSDSRASREQAQAVSFCRSKDATNLALASVGNGPVVVRAAHWATNLDYDWESPITGPLLQRLARRYRLIRYDGRGCGLSDRNLSHISLETMVQDLEAVVECLPVNRFALLGISGGAAASIAYAVRHPARVSRLVLLGGYALGRNKRETPQDAEEAKAFLTMLRSGWGNERSVFMRAFCSFFLPGASAEEIKSFVEFQRLATTGENGVKLRMALDDIDVTELLPRIKVPTVVFHCVHDNLVPFDQGRRLAASIPNCKFVSLESANHALLSSEPAWTKFVSETERFLGDLN